MDKSKFEEFLFFVSFLGLRICRALGRWNTLNVIKDEEFDAIVEKKLKNYNKSSSKTFWF